MTWEAIPFDDIGYFSGDELLKYSDDEVRGFINTFEHNRYTGWRNKDNKWRKYLGLDTTHGKTVLDFGCGFGIEALQFAKSGNEVILADIHKSSLMAAKRVLNVSGYDPKTYLLEKNKKFDIPCDIFYSNGVLHHTPFIREILEWSNAPECRLMLYSDNAWRNATGTEPDRTIPVKDSPHFEQFVAAMDRRTTSDYADWYDEEKLKETVKDLYTVEEFYYIADKVVAGVYSVAILKRGE